MSAWPPRPPSQRRLRPSRTTPVERFTTTHFLATSHERRNHGARKRDAVQVSLAHDQGDPVRPSLTGGDQGDERGAHHLSRDDGMLRDTFFFLLTRKANVVAGRAEAAAAGRWSQRPEARHHRPHVYVPDLQRGHYNLSRPLWPHRVGRTGVSCRYVVALYDAEWQILTDAVGFVVKIKKLLETVCHSCGLILADYVSLPLAEDSIYAHISR